MSSRGRSRGTFVHVEQLRGWQEGGRKFVSIGDYMDAEPKVFLDYTQRALDNAYDQPLWAPNFQEILAQSRVRCDEIRRRFKHFEVKYGEGAEESLEIVPSV